MNKRGFEFSFAWMFAIIVGVVIIFLAIFAATRLIDTSQQITGAEVGEEIGILLNPIETDLEAGRYFSVTFPSETRLFNRCRTTGNFGQQIISASVRSSIGEEFIEPQTDSIFYNKYLFSRSVEQGKRLHLFSMPFELPYRVSSLIFVTADNYCFVQPTRDVEDNLLSLQADNLNVSDSVQGCNEGDITVCFGGQSCDIQVDINSKSVTKNGQTSFYEGNLLYGAIFADPGIYECQVKRLMKKTGELAYLYSTKASILEGASCNFGLKDDLIAYADQIQIDDSSRLREVVILSDEIDRRNDALACKLF